MKNKIFIGIVLLIVVLVGVFYFKNSKKDQDIEKEQKNYGQIEIPENKEEKKNKGDFTTTGETKSFSTKQLADANSALESGIKIDDPENDWLKIAKGTTQSDGKEDNPNPYPFGWTDLKSLNVGADENYLYIKFNLYDRFPSKSLSYNGDKMDGGSLKINYFTFTNSEGKKDWADIITSMSLREQGDGELMPSEIVSMISPKKNDINNKTIFTTYSKEGLLAGGASQDYFLIAVPLKQFNLKLGDKVTFDCSIEAGSEKFHHEAIDILFSREDSKFGDTIEYVLGTNTYKRIPQQNESSHS